MKNRNQALQAASLGCLLAALALLQSCGGGGGGDSHPTWDDSAVDLMGSEVAVRPIVRNFTTAGTYTFTVSGTYTVGSVAANDRLRVFLSMSGQGTISGDDQPTYALSNAGQVVTFKQTSTMVATGDGPWQATVLLFTDGSSGQISNLKMHTVEQ